LHLTVLSEKQKAIVPNFHPENIIYSLRKFHKGPSDVV